MLTDEELRLEIGRRLHRARKTRDFGVRQLAVYADVSPALISRIEKGDVMPSVETFRKISAVLKVRPSDLLPMAHKPDPRLLRQKSVDLAIHESICFTGDRSSGSGGRSYLLVWSGSVSTSECIIRKVVLADQFLELTGEEHKSLRSEVDGTKLILFGQIVPTDFSPSAHCDTCRPAGVSKIHERKIHDSARRLVS